MAGPSASALSLLSVTTAEKFDEPPPAVKVFVSIDDVDLPSCGVLNGCEAFGYENLRFLIANDTYVYFNTPSHTRLTLKVASLGPAEWHLLYQMRIRTGIDSIARVVDKAVVEFSPNSRPISVDVTQPSVRHVKFELRTINKVYKGHPKFDSGDVTLRFSDGTSLRTWRGLLSMASSYMAQMLADQSIDCFDIENFPIGAFKELLLQLYPTGRSLDAGFHALAKVSLSFKVEQLIYKLSSYLVDYNDAPMSLEQKWTTALGMELHPALEELVARSVLCGHWDVRKSQGFTPETYFTPSVYYSIVGPAETAARSMDLLDSRLVNPWKRPDYFTETPLTRAIVFRGTKFFLNNGLLGVHGTTGFTEMNGQLVARFSLEMQQCCAVVNIIPGEVLLALFDSLHLGGPPVEAKYLRPAVIFCYNHGWTDAKQQLEQRLLLEPATSAQHFLQQIRFAERFQLANMLRNCLFRAEASCYDFATVLAKDNFPGVSEDTCFKLKERLCSGWALLPKYVNNLGIRAATSFHQREVRLDRGGALGFEQHWNEGTLVGMDSDYAFGPVEELQAVA